MSAIFPKWTNRLPVMIITGLLLLASALTAGVWYYLTPRYSRVGYQPIQPVSFSHATHNGQLGIDCRYCHNAVEKSWYSNIPAASTCMNCHNQVLKDDPRLALVRESAASGKPIPWVQIHRVPDFVYFNHSVHVNRGISCVECHGQINHRCQMPTRAFFHKVLARQKTADRHHARNPTGSPSRVPSRRPRPKTWA